MTQKADPNQDPKEFDFVAKLLLKNIKKEQNKGKERASQAKKNKDLASIENEMDKAYKN